MRRWFVFLTALSGIGCFVTAFSLTNGLTLLLLICTGVFWVLGSRFQEGNEDV